MRFAALICFLGSLAGGGLAQQSAGASQKNAAIKVIDLGRVSKTTLAKAMENFWKTQHCNSDPVYIINYGSDREIARREKTIINTDTYRRCFDRSLTTLVRGGPGSGPRTIVWTIPKGADNPQP
jgi:hypothetical protein